MPYLQSPCRTAVPSSEDDQVINKSSKDETLYHLKTESSSPRTHPTPFVKVRPMAATVQAPVPTYDFSASPLELTLDEQDQMRWANNAFDAMPHNANVFSTRPAFLASAGGLRHQAHNIILRHDNYDLVYPSHFSDTTCPRSYNTADFSDLPDNSNLLGSYPPNVYQIEPHHDGMNLTDMEIKGQLVQMIHEYEHYDYDADIKKADYSGYRSPYSDLTRDSTPQSGSGGEDCMIDKEQPYAQLIYHALMNAPEKTMVLRDIYNWFKQNTDKASGSETKGWQNSIRHNLSMNGAFEKVDQPCEDSRKGFMWRLTEEAVRDGVKSTTRYRSKQPNKRGHRTQPLPQRQASGAKGGQAARRSAKARRSNRLHDLYTSRSVPSAFDPLYGGTDVTMPYPQSPYFGGDPDFKYQLKNDSACSSFQGSQAAMFSPPRSFVGSPLPHGLPLNDTAYMLDQSSDGSLYTDSPSPPAEEGLSTSVDHDLWNHDLNPGVSYTQDMFAYREFAD